MSTVIDQRVVEMQFENGKFEKGIQNTINSLEKLEDKLQFKDGEKGFDRVASAANSMRLDSIESGVDSITNKFTLMGNIGLQVLQRISSAVVDTGEKILKMFTIDPVKDGWGEFEIKTNSIQTILGGIRGSYDTEEEAIQDIGIALDQLNTYADKTIYSFSDMTSNIGKFTNQGVGLQESVDAIKGISNWAATAGANTQQASHAMYNLAQALSGGAVRLIDWKSIENANMATEEFRNLAVDVAEVIDKKVQKGMVRVGKQSVNVKENFRDSLKAGWLTNEVLITALQIYSGELTEAELKGMNFSDEQIAQFMEIGQNAEKAATTVRTFTMLMDTLKEAAGSGWAQSFDILFGGFEGTKTFFTALNNVLSGTIERSSTIRNELLKTFANDYGGAESLKNAIVGIAKFIDQILKAGDTAWSIVARVMDIPGQFADITAWLDHLMMSINGWLFEGNEFNDYTLAWYNFSRILEGVFSTMVTVFNIVSEAITFVIDLALEFSPILDAILTPIGEIGAAVFGLNNKLNESGGIRAFFTYLDSILSPIIKSFSEVVATIIKFAWAGLKLAKTKMLEWFGKFGDYLSNLPERLTALSTRITDFLTRVKNGFKKLGKIKFKGNLEPVEKIRTVLATFVDTVFGDDALMKTVEWFDNTFKPLFGDLINWVGEKWQKVKTFFTEIPQKLNNFVEKFKTGWTAMKNVKYDKTLTPLQNFSNKMSALIYAIFDEETANKIRDAWNNYIYPTIATAIGWINDNVVPVIDKVTSFIERAWKGLTAAVTDSGENGLEGRVLAFFRVFNNDENAEMPESFKKLFELTKELDSWKTNTLTPFLTSAAAELPKLWDKAWKALFGEDVIVDDKRVQDENAAVSKTVHKNGIVDNILGFIENAKKEIEARLPDINQLWETLKKAIFGEDIMTANQLGEITITHNNGLIDNVLGFIENTKKEIEARLPGIIESIKSVVDPAVHKLTGIYNSLVHPAFGKYDMHSDPYDDSRNDFIDGIFGYLYVIKTQIDEKWPGIWENIKNFGNTVKTEYAGVVNTIKEVIFDQDIAEDAPRSSTLESVLGYLSSVSARITEFYNEHKGTFTEIWEKVKTFLFGEDIDVDNSFIQDENSPVAKKIHKNGLLDNIIAFGERAYNYVTTEGPIVWGKIKEFYNTYVKPVVDTVKEFAKLLITAIHDFITMDVDENASFTEKLAARLGAFDPLSDWIGGKIKGVIEKLTGEGGFITEIIDGIKEFLGIGNAAEEQVSEAVAQNKGNNNLSFIERLLKPVLDLLIPSASAEGVEGQATKALDETKKESGGILGFLSGAAGGVSEIITKLFGNNFFKILGALFAIHNISNIVKGVTGLTGKGITAQIGSILEAVGGIVGSIAQMFMIVGLIRVIGGKDALVEATNTITTVLDKVFGFINTLIGISTAGGLGSMLAGDKAKNISLVADMIESIGTGVKSLMEGLLLLAANILVFGFLEKILSFLKIDTSKTLGTFGLILVGLIGSLALLVGALRLVTAKMPEESRKALFDNLSKISLVIDALVNGVKIFMIAVLAFQIFGGFDELWPEALMVAGSVVILAVCVSKLIEAFAKLDQNMAGLTAIERVKNMVATLLPVLVMALVTVAAVAAILVIAMNQMPKNFGLFDTINFGLLALAVAGISYVVSLIAEKFADLAARMTLTPWMSLLKTFAVVVLAIVASGVILFALEKLMKVYTKDMSSLIFNLGSDLSSFFNMTKDIKLEVFETAAKCLREVVGMLGSLTFNLISPDRVNEMTGAIRDMGANLKLAYDNLNQINSAAFDKPAVIFEKLEKANKTTVNMDDITSKAISIRNSSGDLSLAADAFSGITAEKISQVESVTTFATNVKALADVLNTIPAVNMNASSVGAAVGQLTTTISTENFTISDAGRINELDPEKIKAFFRTMADSMPEEEILNKIANYGDKNNLTAFSLGLTNLTGAVGSYDTALGNVNFDNLSKSTDFLTIVDGLGQKLPKDYSFVDNLSSAAAGGEKDSRLGRFASDIKLLGTAVSEYGKVLETTSGVKLLASALFLTKIASIEKNLNDDRIGSFKDFILRFGQKKITLGDFSTNVKNLGDAIGSFSTNLQTYDNAAFSAAVTNLKDIAGLAVTLRGVMFDPVTGQPVMNELSVLWGLYSTKTADGEERLSDFGVVISRIGNGIAEFTKALTNEKGEVPDMTKFASQIQFLKDIAGLTQDLKDIPSGSYGISQLAADLGGGIAGGEIVGFIKAFEEVTPTALANASSAMSSFGALATAAVSFLSTNGLNNITAASALSSVGSTIKEKLIPDLLELNTQQASNAVLILTKLKEALSGEVNDSLATSVNSVVAELTATPIKPTLQPVLDLSDPSWSQLSGITNPTVGSSFENKYVTENVTNFQFNEVQHVKMDANDLTALKDAIGEVRTSVGLVSGSIRGMYVRMDTGALVGQLVAPMDRALGRRYGRVVDPTYTYSTEDEG